MRYAVMVLLVVVALGVYWQFGMRGERDGLLLEEKGVEEAQVSEILTGGQITDAGDGKKKYLHGERGFSFLFDGDLVVTLLPDLDGDILLLRDSASEREFQIYATYFDEEGPITVERIKQDLPNLVIEEPQAVKIGEGKALDALIFTGESEDFGRTREVWFVGGGQLFQIITHEGNDSFVGPILDTWKFE